MIQRNKAWREGYDAALDGKSDGGFANPYPKGSTEYRDWLSGWSAAYEDEHEWVAQ